MWEDYAEYGLTAKVMSMSRVLGDLPDLRRYQLVIIDESHNLRNREGRRYRAIREYIMENESRCISCRRRLYNKAFVDLSSQLRPFVEDDEDLGIRPEQLLREIGETEFLRRYQAPLRSLAAFARSEHAEDWRELMRIFLVRRTRSFIEQNYGINEEDLASAVRTACGAGALATTRTGAQEAIPTRDRLTAFLESGGSDS